MGTILISMQKSNTRLSFTKSFNYYKGEGGGGGGAKGVSKNPKILKVSKTH